jgi:outer membrane immunogenic protein
MRQPRTLAAGLFAAAGLAALAGEAQAACSNFTGFYIGANVGGASYETTWTDRDSWADQFAIDIGLDSVVRREEGFTAGAQAGFNQQSGCALFGIEADWNWADVEANNTYTGNGVPADMLVTLADEIEWFGSVRGRTGVVVDKLLLYGTAGVAFADISHTWTLTDNSPTTETYGTDDVRWGWTLGGGAEWDLASRWSLKAEALYTSFATETTTVASAGAGANVRFDNLDSIWIGRIGVNYSLGGD